MNIKKKLAAGAAAAAMIFSSFAAPTFAAAPPFGLEPFEFVGTAEQCGGTAGTDTVTAKWDNSTGNPAPSIFLEKTGAQENCAAAGVDIIAPTLEGKPVSNLTELNFDVKGYCGGGAPRFNIQSGNKVAFLGCNNVASTPAGNGYSHVEFTAAQIQAALATAGIAPTDTLDDLYIIFDEPGSTNIDNISVNNQEVGSPTSPQNKEQCKNGGYKNLVGSNGQPFRNQGDCVSYSATGGRNLPAGH